MMKLSSFLVCAAFSLTAASLIAQPGLQPVNLGAAAPFAVLAGSEVTNVPTDATIITGDLGVYPIKSVTGFAGGTVGGAGIVNGTIDIGNQAAMQAEASLLTAIKYARGVPCPKNQRSGCVLAGELGGLFLTPGVYTNANVVTISANPVTLTGDGVYIFRVGGLTVNPGGGVILAGGATAADIFWVTTQATLGSTDDFYGNILSTTSVTFTASGSTTLYGRALAETAVTFAATDDVTIPVALEKGKKPKK
jgi:hypothetical protein